MLPVAPGALGVREGALAWCVAGVGATAAQAASVALLLRMLTWVHSALGGCAYALVRRRRAAARAARDEPVPEEQP